jgi:hypothetical protein
MAMLASTSSRRSSAAARGQKYRPQGVSWIHRRVFRPQAVDFLMQTNTSATPAM